MDKNEFYRKMEGLLNVSQGSITGTQQLSSLKSWDSLTILEFIVLADTDYKSDVQPTDITACNTIADLADLTFAHSALNNELIDSWSK